MLNLLNFVNVNGEPVIESIKHFFLYCPRYTVQRQQLFFRSALLLHTFWLSLTEDQILQLFLFGSEKLGFDDNQIMMRNIQ